MPKPYVLRLIIYIYIYIYIYMYIYIYIYIYQTIMFLLNFMQSRCLHSYIRVASVKSYSRLYRSLKNSVCISEAIGRIYFDVRFLIFSSHLIPICMHVATFLYQYQSINIRLTKLSLLLQFTACRILNL